MKRQWMAALGIVSLAALLAGCGRGETVVQTDAARFPTAVHLYQNGCITCHGSNLQGGIGPSLQHVGKTLTKADIIHRIQVGAGPMPAYAAPGDAILTSQQIQALADWLATKQ